MMAKMKAHGISDKVMGLSSPRIENLSSYLMEDKFADALFEVDL